MGVHREQGKSELGTDPTVLTGHFLAGVEMGPELQKQTESLGVSDHTVSDSLITEHFVI